MTFRMLMCLGMLAAALPAHANAQRVALLRVGAAQIETPRLAADVAPAMRSGVRWKSGAAIGFVVGTVLGAAYIGQGGGEGIGVALYFGLLAGLTGALIQAMATSGT